MTRLKPEPNLLHTIKKCMVLSYKNKLSDLGVKGLSLSMRRGSFGSSFIFYQIFFSVLTDFFVLIFVLFSIILFFSLGAN